MITALKSTEKQGGGPQGNESSECGLSALGEDGVIQNIGADVHGSRRGREK